MTTWVVFLLVIFIVAATGYWYFYKEKENYDWKYVGIAGSPTNPNSLLSLVDENTIFSDYPNAFSNASDFGQCLVRSTNAFVWGSMFPDKDDAVAKALLNKSVDKILSKIPATDLTAGWYPIPGNWFAFGGPWRAFLNSLWLYLTESKNTSFDMKSLIERMELVNTSLKNVCGIAQKGSNVTLLARQKIYFLKIVKGQDFNADDYQFIKDNLPKLVENKMWPTDGNITDEGGYIFHVKMRSYGYLNEQFNAYLPVRAMSKLNFEDSYKLMDSALYKISTYTGRITPSAMSRHLSNLEGIKNEKRIGIEFVDGLKLIVQSQKEWSWAGWANNYSLGLCELEIGTTEPYSYFTYPFSVYLNNSDLVLKLNEWKLTPGIIYPTDESKIPEWSGSSTKIIMNTKPSSFFKSAGLISTDKKFGVISDTINLPDIFPNWIERHILVTENGLKCLWYVHQQDIDLNFVLYIGEKIEETTGGFVVDDVVFISTNYNDEFKIGSGYTDLNLMALSREFNPKDVDEPLLFNIMYKKMDSNLLKRYKSQTNVLRIQDPSLDVDWISTSYSGQNYPWNYFRVGDMFTVNRAYDDNNDRSTIYTKPTVSNFPTFPDFKSVVNGKFNNDGTITMFNNSLYGYI